MLKTMNGHGDLSKLLSQIQNSVSMDICSLNSENNNFVIFKVLHPSNLIYLFLHNILLTYNILAM